MAITRTATPTSLPFTTTGAKSLAHTCAANTTLLLLVIQVDAATTITGTPTWNTSENFSLIRDTGTGSSAGDVRQIIYGLVNPTAGSFNIDFTVGTSVTVEGIAFAVSYLGTVTSSVAAAAIYLDEQINNAAATTVAMNEAVGGTAGRTAFAAATFFGGDGDPAAETASGGQFAEIFDGATGTSTTADRSYWVGDAINWTPAAVTVDWTGTASDECVGTVIELVPFVGPIISSIDTDNDTVDTRTGVVIAGSTFGASETGSAKVEISNNATYGSGTVVEVDVTSWSATSITVTLRRESDSATLAGLFTLPLSPAYLWVTDSAGTRNPAGFQFTLRPPGPTPFANLNTPATLEVDTTYLVRARVENTGGVGDTDFRWVYSHESGAWTPITTTSSVVKAVAASSFANGDDVPEVIGGSGSYIANNDAASEDGTITLPAAFSASGAVEFVLSFQIIAADVSDEDAILLRLEQGDGTDLDTYTNTASITVNKAVVGSVGTAVGIGIATAVGAVRRAGAGMALGTGTASAPGVEVFAGIGAATGTGTATAVGVTRVITSSVGTSAGAGTASAIGGQVLARIGLATATGAATAIGVARQIIEGAGTATGIGTAEATGAVGGGDTGAGIALGVGTAAAIGKSTTAALGTGLGTGTATGTGRSAAAGTGTATGAGAAAGTGRATNASPGVSAGQGAANAVGRTTGAGTGTSLAGGAATGAGAVLQAVLPNAMLASTNLQDSDLVSPPVRLVDIQDDPDAPDGNKWSAIDPTADTMARIGFADAGGNLVAAQAFEIYVNKTGDGTPTVAVELWEDGVLVQVLISGVQVTSLTGQKITVPWAPDLITNPANAEIRIAGTAT